MDWKQEWAARSTQPNFYALWNLENGESRWPPLGWGIASESAVLWEARKEMEEAFREMIRVSKSLLWDGAPACKGRS